MRWVSREPWVPVAGLALLTIFWTPAAPAWLFLAVGAVWLAWTVALALRATRRETLRELRTETNCCRHCGYSLRGLRAPPARYAGTCPECGTPFS